MELLETRKDSREAVFCKQSPMNLPECTLFVDLGSSLTKGFFTNGNGQTHVLTMNSEVSFPIALKDLDIYRQLKQPQHPDKSAWIKRGQEIRAVGLLAQNFGIDTGTTERKERRAVDKILAAIGVMLTRLDLPRTKGFKSTPIPLRLGVVLPFDEFASRDAIIAELKAHSRFEFCDMPIAFELTDHRFAPEGFCLSRHRAVELLKRQMNPASRNMIVLMLGHRNTSFLLLEQDQFQKEKSTSQGPGFITAVKQAFKSGVFQTTDHPKLLNALVTGQTKVLLTGDDQPSDISKAVEAGLNAYWLALERFLKSNLSTYLTAKTEIVISGGASSVVLKRLETLLKKLGIDRKQIHFYNDPELAQLLIDNGYDRQDNSIWVSRMGDAYAGFKGLIYSPQKRAA